jgi:hypothetical protein
VIVFDEAHAMANAAGGAKGARGPRKASLQGLAGLALQNRMPKARVLYVSATGATTPDNLAYASRLGVASRTASDAKACARMILDEGVSLALTGGLWLRRARVMNRWRIEVVGGAAHRPVLGELGCFIEIIHHTPRVFAPVDEPVVLEAVLRRWPVQTVSPAAA